MAQTNEAFPLREGQLSISLNGSTWTDYSGWTAMVSQSGGERAVGGAYTFDGDLEIVTTGKRAHFVYTVRMIYTEEGAHNPYPVIEDAYLNRTPIYLRWIPFGGVSGNQQFITDQGWVINSPFPSGEANDPNPAQFEFDFVTRFIARSTYIG